MAKGMSQMAVIVILLVAVLFFGEDIKAAIGGKGVTPTPTPTSQCPDTGQTTLYARVKNIANTSKADWDSATLYVYNGGGSYVGSITTTTTTGAYASLTVPCGQKYVIEMIATDGNFGVNSKIQGSDKGTVTPDGFVDLGTVAGESFRVSLESVTHCPLQMYAFDDTQTGRYSAYGGTAGWNSSHSLNVEGCWGGTAAATNETVGTDGEYNAVLWLKTNESFCRFNDYDTFILVDADTASQWQEPSIQWDGDTLTDVMSSLSGEEAKAYSDYEYAYQVPANDKIDYNKHVVGLSIKAQSGSNPSKNIRLTFATRGNYLSIDGITVNSEMVKDDSANTQVFATVDAVFGVQ